MSRIRNYLGRDLKKKRSFDVLSKKRRSKLMARVRSKDTRFERDFISVLRKTIKNKFQTNVADIKGKPDIVFLKDKTCIFLDSDFWHGWQYPRWKHLLKNDFWRRKIEANRKRDKKITVHLRRNNWRVLRFWEHSIKKDIESCVRKIEKALTE